MVMLTEAVRRHLFGADGDGRIRAVIPCCADLRRLDTGTGAVKQTRAELSAAERPIMIYVGKFSGWYLEREMVSFFLAARRLNPELLFVILTQSDRSIIQREFARAGVGPDDYRITRAATGDVGRYLVAADFGLSFVKPCFSKISSSPTKIGEYLGAGLPVVSTAGIGDVDQLLKHNGVGVLVSDLRSEAFDEAAQAILAVGRDSASRERCRIVARRELSLEEVGVPRYDALYEAVARA
jgi:glycosyltransferase involved in cell wall biosynthesis